MSKRITGTRLNALLNIGAKHARYREDGKWYHHLIDFPGVLFDENGYLVFNSEDDYLNHHKLQHGVDLHVIAGISSTKEYHQFTGEQKRQIILGLKSNLNEESLRVIRQVETVIRNRKLVEEIKQKYNHTCQICGKRLKLDEDLFYSEVHHIKPLGNPHNGPDKPENMISVCPNDHVLLDMGSIHLDTGNLHILKHQIGEEYVAYHNEIISKSR